MKIRYGWKICVKVTTYFDKGNDLRLIGST
jgi:hypothetical protein